MQEVGGCLACTSCRGFKSISKTGKFCANCSHNHSKHYIGAPNELMVTVDTKLPPAPVTSPTTKLAGLKLYSSQEELVAPKKPTPRPSLTISPQNPLAKRSPMRNSITVDSPVKAETTNNNERGKSIKDKIAKFSGSGKPDLVTPSSTRSNPGPIQTRGLLFPQTIGSYDSPLTSKTTKSETSPVADGNASGIISLKDRIAAYKSNATSHTTDIPQHPVSASNKRRPSAKFFRGDSGESISSTSPKMADSVKKNEKRSGSDLGETGKHNAIVIDTQNSIGEQDTLIISTTTPDSRDGVLSAPNSMGISSSTSNDVTEKLIHASSDAVATLYEPVTVSFEAYAVNTPERSLDVTTNSSDTFAHNTLDRPVLGTKRRSSGRASRSKMVLEEIIMEDKMNYSDLSINNPNIVLENSLIKDSIIASDESLGSHIDSKTTAIECEATSV